LKASIGNTTAADDIRIAFDHYPEAEIGMGSATAAFGSAVEEYLAVLDDAAFGAASEVTPKFIAPADPVTRWDRPSPAS
jgi:hypothetical protein